MKFTAVGDIIIGRRIQADYEGYEELSNIINKGDFRFFNLETTLHREGECYASETSGGTYLRTDPEVLDDVKKFGFNATSFNNNHVMDFAFDGLIRTLETVEESGLVHAGVGRNLGDASAPKYLDTKNGRVAMISFNSTLMGEMCAGEQTGRIKGRPGVNPLRATKEVELIKEDFLKLKEIIKRTNLNAQRELEKREGYHGGVDNTSENIGGISFKEGKETRMLYKINALDKERAKKAIYEAKLVSDYIVISLHSHEMGGDAKEEPAEFLKEFSRFCIDCGANAVVGHGPHLLRPVEIYKDCPIFYSLGDFILQLYNVEFAPAEFYNQYGLTPDATVHELLKKRSKDFSIGLMTDRRMFEAVIPYWESENGKIKSLTLYPISLAMDGNKSELGLPRLATELDFFDDFIRRSAEYGTKIEKMPDGTLKCSW